MPIAQEIMDHPELASFIQRFEAAGGHSRMDPEQGCLGFSIGIPQWRTFIENALPGKDAAFQLEVLDRLFESGGVEQGEGLQVNFHQNPFDTPERFWRFHLSQGNFTSFVFNRVNWYMAPKNQITTPFPLHVDLESASTCNMNCPMCYRRGLKETGQMDMELFKKLVDECAAEGVFSIRLSWRGETLTHPRIKEMIAYACERIPNVSFLTNAFFIDEGMAECFIDCGVSYVAVSFDGIGEIYEKVRAPASFEENRLRLERLKRMRDGNGSRLPQIRLCTIWPAVKDNPEAYTEAMRPVSDYMVCNPYINFMGPMRIKPDFICQYPWERLVVGFNGDVQCCTGWEADDIILGNAWHGSLKQMWHSDSMEQIRRIHSEGRRMNLASCARCRHGSKGDENADIDEILQRRW
jgi:radical SAM protein with 4Fe4S-binding SPASM domain